MRRKAFPVLILVLGLMSIGVLMLAQAPRPDDAGPALLAAPVDTPTLLDPTPPQSPEDPGQPSGPSASAEGELPANQEIAPQTQPEISLPKTLLSAERKAALVAAKARGQKIIALDPGHGGSEVGATAVLADGTCLREKEVNLRIAQRLRELLEQEGYAVVMSRETDEGALPEAMRESQPGYFRIRSDLQARVGLANEAQADLFISIHNNGAGSPEVSGTEVWYSKDRAFAEQNRTLAQLVHDHLLAQLQAAGYTSVDRGIKDDSNFRTFRGRTFNIFVIGPARAERFHTRATQMPGVLGETLFLSNPREAALLAREEIIEAIAQGYLGGIQAYLGTDISRLPVPPDT